MSVPPQGPPSCAATAAGDSAEALSLANLSLAQMPGPANARLPEGAKPAGNLRKCDMCDDEPPATHFCNDCNEALCQGCHDYHTKNKRWKSHTVCEIDALLQPSSFLQQPTPATAKRRKTLQEAARAADSSSDDNSARELHMETESDSATITDSETDEYEPHDPDTRLASCLLDTKTEDELVQQFLEELPVTFQRRCNHDIKHQIRCVIRKFKGVYDGNGLWSCRRDWSEETMPEIIAGGNTQNGKTMIKILGIWIAWRLGASDQNAPKIATVLLSTTVKGTASLSSKMEKAFNKLPLHLRPPLVFVGSAPYTQHQHRDRLRDCIAHGGCIIVNDTAARVQHAISSVECARGHAATKGTPLPLVQLFIDEADAFYRNAENPIKLEQAVFKLCEAVKPVLRMQVSATLIPVFLHLKSKQRGVDVDSIIFTQPGDDYNGVKDFKPFTTPEGDDIFLSPGDLTKSNGYYNETVGMFYKDAFVSLLPDGAISHKKRSLLLNITNPGVGTTNNVYDHAHKIQMEYPHVGCIVFVAKEIKYFPPKEVESEVETFDKNWTVSQVIQHADDNHGLDMPLTVIGYSQMIRGDSFRSDRRVPTHICCALGTQMSIEKMVQAMGRATYGSSTLQDNGFSHVKVLTLANDFCTAKAYPKWLEEMSRMLRDGMTIQEALSTDAVYTDQANVLLCQPRSVGQKQDKLLLETSFEKPEPGLEREVVLHNRRNVLGDPINKLVYDVAKEHYVETPESFRDEVRGGEDIGGTAEEYLSILLSVEEMSASLDIRAVRTALQSLTRTGCLKSSIQIQIAPARARRPGGTRYFIPDRDVL